MKEIEKNNKKYSKKFPTNDCWKQITCDKSNCKQKSCKFWVNKKEYLNCINIAASTGPKTLREIGEMHELTRMRICQIEKYALAKVKKFIQK